MDFGKFAMACAGLVGLIMCGVGFAFQRGLIHEDLRGAHQVSCWSLTHPELQKEGKDYALKANSFVACVVIDTRTGKVVSEFVPTIPGMRK